VRRFLYDDFNTCSEFVGVNDHENEPRLSDRMSLSYISIFRPKRNAKL